MNKVTQTAILLGATGLTGGLLLHKLLKDNSFSKVTVFSRKPLAITHGKLEVHLIDVLQLQEYATIFYADVVYCCIGSTKKKTPDHEVYRAIDYGIPVAAAQLCKKNGIPVFIVVSALGADVKSTIFYSRIKGEMEEKVLAMHIEKTHILQPSLIAGNREERRSVEWISIQMMKLLNYMLVGSLKKYRSISPEVIADCMLWLTKNSFPWSRIASDQIGHIVQTHKEL
ncbi:NAD(P)H-binding protein [Arenibacter sp. GZD96]|uniref:NAD(P)H-binding protein n=1 Tax=Aurantibrevibacter litoralis TaxID=3106030 RepID=UPI002AFEDAAD|nr:NAD(P)H-binding protein [Arenibacter sp. GZD-96]MEA1785670.1 NAD(P)H-binding protein [Arenibacter sp. GZD-96]